MDFKTATGPVWNYIRKMMGKSVPNSFPLIQHSLPVTDPKKVVNILMEHFQRTIGQHSPPLLNDGDLEDMLREEDRGVGT